MTVTVKIEGPCTECPDKTDAVVLYAGKASFLCVPCQRRIRSQTCIEKGETNA